MSYQVLYRRFRPTTFADIAGQEHITEILKNQIKNNRVAHAYLFCGSRGTGKTTTAKVFANAINCLSPVDGEPCGKCAYCTSNDISDVIEIDAASNRGIDEIRQLRDKVNYMPAVGKYRVYIIDEVHMLTTEAFNALLKTLEEPPEHIVFIFATTEAHKLLPTILSRCQRYDFARIPLSVQVARLKEVLGQIGAGYEEEALNIIAENSDGALRDALSFLDKALNFGSGDMLTVEDVTAALGLMGSADVVSIAQNILREDVNGAFVSLNKAIHNGADPLNIISQLIDYFRDGMICLNTSNPSEIIQKGQQYIESVKESAKVLDNECFVIFITSLSRLKADARYAPDVRSLLECEIVRLSDRETLIGDYSAAARIEQLEKKLAGLSEKVKELSSGEVKVIREVVTAQVTEEPKEELPAPREHRTSMSLPPKEYYSDKTEIRRLQDAISFASNYVMNRDRNILLRSIFDNLRVYGYTEDTIYVYPTAVAVPIMDSYDKRGGKEILEKAIFEKLSRQYNVIVTQKPAKKPEGPARAQSGPDHSVPNRPNLRSGRRNIDVKQIQENIIEPEISEPAYADIPAEAYNIENLSEPVYEAEAVNDTVNDEFDIPDILPDTAGDDFQDLINDTFGELTEL